MPSERRGALTLLVVSLTLAAPALADGPAGQHQWWPTTPGAEWVYQSYAGRNPERLLRWTVQYEPPLPLAGGALRVLRRLRIDSFGPLAAVQRKDAFAVDRRGVYTFLAPVGEAGQADASGAYGPRPLLPTEAALTHVDAVWRYEGWRPLPPAFQLFGLGIGPEGGLPTSGRYHVLKLEPVETPAGTFDAVQVTGIESVREVPLPDGNTLSLMLRCRRWYAPGVGLVRELIELPQARQAGQLVTELSELRGLPAAQLAAAAQQDADHG